MWLHRLAVVLGLLVSGADVAALDVAAAADRLPGGVRPLHYDVSIVPDAAAMRFTGRVQVALEVDAPTPRIVFNASGLSFSSLRLAPLAGGRSLAPTAVDVQRDTETVALTFARPIAPGRYRLHIDYAGVIGTQAAGLFAIDYDGAAGRERALYTQLENSHARNVFPSWDEPAYKATFRLEATVASRAMAVSNMPVAAAKELGDGRRRVRFATTPRMSTYLLFFAVGDFERATARAGATELGVVARAGAAAQAGFALDATKAILREYDDYFAFPFPLPKLDNVASPGNSTTFSAMENWGAIFTFEKYLLLDPASATQSDRQLVFAIAAHEIAHQWFGNLVTMSWWDDVWLNEGLTSWLTSRTVRKLRPEWNSAFDALGSRERAMALDALATAQPVVRTVETVTQANQAFDAITYSKGAAVIRMMEAWLGDDAWREGVRLYVKANAYGNTVSDDLWRAVEAATGKPIGAVARDFTLQPGIPLVRVERSTCEGGATTLELAQAEFSADRPQKAPARWRVPVVARAPGGAAASTLVEGTARLVVPGCGAVVVNAGQSGYYRTMYAPEPMAAIRAGFAKLEPIDQLGVLDDLWALGLAGTAPIADALVLTAQLRIDAEPKIWTSVAERCLAIDVLLRGEPRRQARWRAWCRSRLAPVLARVGWQAGAGDDAPVVVLRSTLIRALGDLADAPTIAEARRRYGERATRPDAYPPELRKAILAVVAGQADAATWDELRAAAKAEKDPPTKDRLYDLLARAHDEALAARALALAVSDEPAATTGAGMIRAVAERHPDLAFDFAVAHRDRVDRLVDAQSVARYYVGLASASRDPAMVGKIREFAAASIAAPSRRRAEVAMAEVAWRATVARERLPAIDDWLQAQGR